ncbi:UDP-N-acetylglucosamine transferase subunit ALG14 [Histomonas meleagridis]|uniref:UDP-N-acetylglucosamine transferase subunit ALG14-like n=1 Tax=Histomonas meleagridis TaxID=135588 RepID=UPI0035595BC0|nr:UDP-N-acetylglucosamine transferase subunit ALG14 [Histomonas meleagridis]KAH0799481.1 UDP-N-acetylglucosamine transferase subunit ALG14-like [Histomonas meleagridis]
MNYLLVIFFTLLILVLFRLYKCLPGLCPKKRYETKPIDVLVVLGSGGHTGEMMPLVHSLVQSPNYKKFIFVFSDTDQLSKKHPLIPKDSQFISIPRARKVGQSFFTSFFTTIYSFIATLPVMFTKPQLLLVNGPGVCYPVVLTIFLGNMLGITNCSIVFIESVCRVKSLSLTGKLIYPLCDLFFVYWPDLLKFKKRAQLLDLYGLNKNK